MSKPTAAQRRALAVLATGKIIYTDRRDESYVWIAGNDGYLLHRLTFPGLLRHGWIKANDDMGDTWAITDRGRAALAEVERIAEAAGKERVGA